VGGKIGRKGEGGDGLFCFMCEVNLTRAWEEQADLSSVVGKKKEVKPLGKKGGKEAED